MENSEVAIPFLVNGLEVIRKKRKICKNTFEENLDNIIATLQTEADEIEQITDEEDSKEKIEIKVKDLADKVLKMKILDKVVVNHKKFYIYLSKFNKYSEKVLNKSINELFVQQKLDKEILNKAIYQHFLYKKNTKITEIMKKEINNRLNHKLEKKLLEIHNIFEELQKYNTDPAIQWALKNEKALDKINSDLLFSLYQQKFIYLRTSPVKQNYIQFARDSFPRFFPKYTDRIERLMGSLVYDKASENPRYADLYDPCKWEEVSQKFFQHACRIYNIPSQSTLSVALEAGTLVLPQFLKYQSLLPQNEWDPDQELPIETNIGKKYSFHSVFICPITKEKCSDMNPPVALNCGHVISTLALKKIFSHKKNRYKCPYCPTEISISSSKKLYFE